jgi:hypothetical protein
VGQLAHFAQLGRIAERGESGKVAPDLDHVEVGGERPADRHDIIGGTSNPASDYIKENIGQENIG